MLCGALSPDDGAALLFWGVVRNRNDGRAVSSLEYSAYAEMAEREMLRIADEARARFGTGAIHVVHRIGLLRDRARRAWPSPWRRRTARRRTRRRAT